MTTINCPYCTAKYKANEEFFGKTFQCRKCKLKFKVSADNRKKIPFIANLVLVNKLIKESVLSKILYLFDRMKLKGDSITLEELLINKGGIKPGSLLEIYKKLPEFDREYSKIAVEKNFATDGETQDALNNQKTLFNKGEMKSIGRILIENEVITERQHLQILEIQNERSDFETVKKLLGKQEKTVGKVLDTELNENEKELCSLIVSQNILSKEKIDTIKKDVAILNKEGQNTNLEQYIIEKKILKKELLEYLKKVVHFKEIRRKDKKTASEMVKENPNIKQTVDAAVKKQLDLFSKEKRVERLKDLLPKDIPEKKPVKEKKEKVDEAIRKVRKPELVISGDNLEAVIKIPKAESNSIKDIVTYEKVERIMINALLKQGVKTAEEIRSELNTNPFEAKKIVVAKGVPAKPTVHAEIKTYFQKEFLKAGKVNAFGMIDFRDRGEVPQVKKGELIAEKFPSVKGVPGVDVFGQPIGVETAMDDKLLGGTGTYFSDDRLKLYAKVNGQPALVVGKIEIHEVHEIKGDVDYSTGHVIFNGNIRVPGKVCSGFKVKGVNVEVGDIDGGIVSASGDVVVKNGIVGGRVITKGSVTANFISDASINALGNVIVNKQLIDSKVASSSTVSIENGQISNCQIVARQGIVAKEIGTNHSKPCRIAVGTMDHIEQEVHRLKKTILDNKTKLEESMSNIKDSYERMKNCHADIIALAKKQNKNLAEEKEIQQKVDKYEKAGIKDKLVTQEAILETCKKNIAKMDLRLKDIMKSQDKPLLKVLEFTAPIAEQKALIEQSEKDLEDFERWEEENPGKAEVHVSFHLNEGTYIKGVASEITIKDNLKKVVVREIIHDSKHNKNEETDEIEVESEMVVENVKK